MVMRTKERKYYKKDGGQSTSTKKRLFLVRQHDNKENKVVAHGPFRNEDEAVTLLNSYLKSGVCCWLVSYNG
jgi:uncharacterized protein YprB with RNaseH-like and TPR domain|tara:strand:- start:4800 stop:5015 length:216 start_codon:yes stop_codon:yes gene_type:complete